MWLLSCWERNMHLLSASVLNYWSTCSVTWVYSLHVYFHIIYEYCNMSTCIRTTNFNTGNTKHFFFLSFKFVTFLFWPWTLGINYSNLHTLKLFHHELHSLCWATCGPFHLHSTQHIQTSGWGSSNPLGEDFSRMQ